MSYNESTYKASVKYRAAKIKRVPLDMQLSEYEELKQASAAAGVPVNTYIKQAIREKMQRDQATPPAGDSAAGQGGR